MRKAADNTLAEREQAAKEQRAKEEARIAQGGLAGQKLGKHIVREGEVDVQLGEDLSESLRGLQVCAICVLPSFLHANGDPVFSMAPWHGG